MDRNTIIGFVLIIAIVIGFSIYNAPSKQEIAEKRRNDSIAAKRQAELDSIAEVKKKEQIQATTPIISNEKGQSTIANNDSIKNKQLTDALGVFSQAAKGKNEFYTVENDLFAVTFSTKGGKPYKLMLKNYKTYTGEPVVLFDGDSTVFGFSFFANNRTIFTNDLYFQPVLQNGKAPEKDIQLNAQDSLQIAFRLYVNSEPESTKPNKKYLEFVYTIRPKSYLMGFQVNFNEMQDVIAFNTNYVTLDWKSYIRLQEKSAANERHATTIYYQFSDKEVDYLSETKDDEDNLKTKVRWISFKQQFFCQAIISDAGFSSALIKSTNLQNDKIVKKLETSITFPFVVNNHQQFNLNFYYGPNHFKTLQSYDYGLERQIPLGWSFAPLAWINRFAIIPIFNILSGFNLNYGIIILIMTVILKIVLLPIAYKTYLSSAKMRILKPEVDEIGKKYPKQEDAMKKQKEVMALYKKAGVNPLAGCIPMLLQLPILIALFRFFPASIELRQQSFLWAEDLSTYDSILDLPFTIPFYGDHVSLFTLLMTISTLIYTKLNNDMMGSTNQMPGMKVMMYLMPIMFLGVFNSYSSGLSYYYFLANMFTFGQMFLIRRFVNEEKLHKKIQDNKKRPDADKKSGFQKRLEEMAKKRGVQLPK